MIYIIHNESIYSYSLLNLQIKKLLNHITKSSIIAIIKLIFILKKQNLLMVPVSLLKNTCTCIDRFLTSAAPFSASQWSSHFFHLIPANSWSGVCNLDSHPQDVYYQIQISLSLQTKKRLLFALRLTKWLIGLCWVVYK